MASESTCQRFLPFVILDVLFWMDNYSTFFSLMCSNVSLDCGKNSIFMIIMIKCFNILFKA